MNKPLNLIAHCGASYVARNDLGKVVLPMATATHIPIGHDYFVDLIQDQLNHAGLHVMNEGFAMSKDGANMFGVMQCAARADSDYTTVIGMRNSHKKEFRGEIVCGSGVFVCDNLAFSGEVHVGRKHTGAILDDLPIIIADAIGRVVDLNRTQESRYEAYKSRPLVTFEAEHLIVEMLRRNIINPTRIPKVVEQWDNPDHEEFARTGRSAWRLFNAATESMKGLSLNEMMPRSKRLHDLVDEVVEFEPGQFALAA